MEHLRRPTTTFFRAKVFVLLFNYFPTTSNKGATPLQRREASGGMKLAPSHAVNAMFQIQSNTRFCATI